MTSLPSPGSGFSSAQSIQQDDKKVQSRPKSPHQDLPSPQDLLDEGQGRKEKAKAKETPLQPPSLCRFRDVACLEKQRQNGGKISLHATPTAQPEPTQSASAAPKAAGNWFQRMGQKISGA